MQVHEYSFIIDAPRDEIWAAMHPPLAQPGTIHAPRIIEHGNVRIEILNEGDEHGQGLVRHCYFAVPKYLLSGGRAQSWETVSEVRAPEFSRYDAIGKPLWSQAMGWQKLRGPRRRPHPGDVPRGVPRLQPGDARRCSRSGCTDFISKDNDKLVKAGIEGAADCPRRAERLTIDLAVNVQRVSSPFDDVDLDRMRRRRTVKWTLPGSDVLAAWVAEMDFRAAPPIRAALLDAVDREEFGYTEADLSELTTACAGYLSRGATAGRSPPPGSSRWPTCSRGSPARSTASHRPAARS